jgi:hypothetical protein
MMGARWVCWWWMMGARWVCWWWLVVVVVVTCGQRSRCHGASSEYHQRLSAASQSLCEKQKTANQWPLQEDFIPELAGEKYLAPQSRRPKRPPSGCVFAQLLIGCKIPPGRYVVAALCTISIGHAFSCVVWTSLDAVV